LRPWIVQCSLSFSQFRNFHFSQRLVDTAVDREQTAYCTARPLEQHNNRVEFMLSFFFFFVRNALGAKVLTGFSEWMEIAPWDGAKKSRRRVRSSERRAELEKEKYTSHAISCGRVINDSQ
jgi:hypothetical protein